MAANRIFFPGILVDEWVLGGAAELEGDRLLPTQSARMLLLEEAVHVLAEATGGRDVHELVGRVKTVETVRTLGAEILGASMLIGELAYDVVPGFLAAPLAAPPQGIHPSELVSGLTLRFEAAGAVERGAVSDEELLARYLMRSLE